jgi:endonuclease YncB( thermonuclease family)
MEILTSIFVALLGFYGAFSGAPSVAQTGQSATALYGRVIGVSDGATIKVLLPGNEAVRVRLSEIDAPESSQAFGSRAKQELSKLCFGRQATLAVQTKDRYDRLVARVACNGTDAQSHMVGSGYAWVYEFYAKDRSLSGLQNQARSDRKGLWRDDEPVPPWLFRKEASKKK